MYSLTSSKQVFLLLWSSILHRRWVESVQIQSFISQSQWYTKRYRIALWASASGLAQIIGGLVAYGIAEGDITHKYSLALWKILFHISGLLTIILGVVFWIVASDDQLNPLVAT